MFLNPLHRNPKWYYANDIAMRSNLNMTPWPGDDHLLVYLNTEYTIRHITLRTQQHTCTINKLNEDHASVNNVDPGHSV